MELVCLDIWSAEDNKQRSVDVLVLTDHFTKLAHAFPCTNQQAKQVARKLWDNVFCVYGFPGRIHTDQGANFESELIAELLKLSGLSKSHTTAYHPMGNGGTERFNRTLGSMLRSLPLREKAKWPQQRKKLVEIPVTHCPVLEGLFLFCFGFAGDVFFSLPLLTLFFLFFFSSSLFSLCHYDMVYLLNVLTCIVWV